MAPHAQPVTGAKLIGKLFPALRYKPTDFINRAAIHDEIPNFGEPGFVATKPRELRQEVVKSNLRDGAEIPIIDRQLDGYRSVNDWSRGLDPIGLSFQLESLEDC